MWLNQYFCDWVMPDGVDSWWFMIERILIFMIGWLSDKWMFIIYKLILWSWVVVFDWIKMMTWIQDRLNDQWRGIIHSFIHPFIHSFLHWRVFYCVQGGGDFPPVQQSSLPHSSSTPSFAALNNMFNQPPPASTPISHVVNNGEFLISCKQGCRFECLASCKYR